MTESDGPLTAVLPMTESDGPLTAVDYLYTTAAAAPPLPAPADGGLRSSAQIADPQPDAGLPVEAQLFSSEALPVISVSPPSGLCSEQQCNMARSPVEMTRRSGARSPSCGGRFVRHSSVRSSGAPKPMQAEGVWVEAGTCASTFSFLSPCVPFVLCFSPTPFFAVCSSLPL